MLAVVGFLAGTFSGLFGIGGGIITVPAVLFLTPLNFRQSVALSLLTILASSPFGVWRHARAGNVRWRTGAELGLAGIAGILAATVIDPYLSERLLLWVFAAFLLFAAQRLAYGTQPLLRLAGATRVLVTGFWAGLAAKLLGIGGGLLIVPALALAGLGIHVAVATSLVSVAVNAAASTAVNALRVAGPWALYAVPAIVGSLAGVQVGSRWALRTRAPSLQSAFALLLALVSLLLVHRSLG